ncbi:MAG: PulJ/GspJ family protein [Gemmatimonadales bacterium]
MRREIWSRAAALFRARRVGAERPLQRATKAGALTPRDAGFTLIEVLVALTVGSLVVLFAHRLFNGVADGTRRLADARQALDRESNARRWLAEAFGSLVVGEAGGAFAGRADRVEFGSWQLTREGWLVRRRIGIELRERRLVADVGAGDSVVLADSVKEIRFYYLLDPGATPSAQELDAMPGERAAFVREWISPVSAPLAVRMRIARAAGMVDTLLLIVGPRG